MKDLFVNKAIKGMFAGAAMMVAGSACADEIAFIGPSISAGVASGTFQLVDDNGGTIILEKATPPFLYDMTEMAISCDDMLSENGYKISRGHLLYFLRKHLSRDYGTQLDESIRRAVAQGADACLSPNIS